MFCCRSRSARSGWGCSCISFEAARCCRCTTPNSTRRWVMSEPRENPEVAHEESDVNVRAIFGFGLGLLAVGVLVHLLLWLLFNYYSREAARVPRDFPLSADYQ